MKIVELLFRFLIRRWWGWPFIVVGFLLAASLLIWNTFPDSIKSNILEDFPGLQSIPPKSDENNRDQSSLVPVLPRPSLAGKWLVHDTVLSTTYGTYEGIQVYYLVGISQSGDDVLVNGEKDSEVFRGEKRILQGKNRTRLMGEGRLEANKGNFRLKLSANEESVTRNNIKTEFALTVVSDILLDGAFSSDAASSTGVSKWTRRNDAK